MNTALELSEATGDAPLSIRAEFRQVLFEAARVEIDLREIDAIEGSRRSVEPVWSSWQEALRGEVAPLGLVLRSLRASFEEVLSGVRPGAPLVTWTPGAGWIALLERDRGRVLVASSDAPNRWVAADAVRSTVDPTLLKGPKTWIALEAPLLPTSSGRHGGPSVGPVAKLLAIARPERSDVIAIVLYSGFTGLMTLAIPVAVQQLVNTVAFGGLVQPVVVLATLLFMGLAIAALLYGSQAVLAELLQQRLFVRACLDLARRLPRLHADAYESRSMTAYVNRFFDLVTVQKTGARLLLEASGVILQSAVGLLVLSLYHPLMLALSIFLLGAMALVTFSLGRHAPESAVRESTAKYAIAAWMEELVRHPTILRSSAGRARAESRADALISSWVVARKNHYRIVLRQFIAALGLQVVVNAGLLALGGYLVVAGELTLGQLVASEIVVASVVASFSRLAKHYEDFYDLLAASVKVSELFELPLERAPEGRDTKVDPSSPCLRGQDLSVVGKSGRSLGGLSLAVGAGERVAFEGSSAALRSACIDVLAGLRSPMTGFVTFNGCDLRDASPQTIRDRMIVVRTAQIVPGSILENLAMGRADSRIDQLQSALADVGLLDEIRKLPDGLETRIDERGGPLDADQALRLELARAILARPDVLFLDPLEGAFSGRGWATALDSVFAKDAPWTVVTTSCSAQIRERCDRTLRLDERSHGRVESGEPIQAGAVDDG